MKLAAQSLLQEPHLVTFGSRRSLFHGNGRLLFARTKSSYGPSTAGCRPTASLTEATPRITRFASGRLSFCSQLLPKEGGRKVSTGAAAVRFYLSFLTACRSHKTRKELFHFTCYVSEGVSTYYMFQDIYEICLCQAHVM